MINSLVKNVLLINNTYMTESLLTHPQDILEQIVNKLNVVSILCFKWTCKIMFAKIDVSKIYSEEQLGMFFFVKRHEKDMSIY